MKSSKLYFIDVGLAAWLLELKTAGQVQRDPLRGALYENLLIMEAVKRMLNHGEQTNLHFYRDTNGREVDLLIPTATGFDAVEIKSGQTFQPEFVSGIGDFRKSLASDKTVNAIVWYNGQRKTQYKDAAVSNPLIHGFKWQ